MSLNARSRFIPLAAVAIAATLIAQTSAPSSRRRPERVAPGALELSGSVRMGEAPSKLLGRAVRYAAYLPKGYDDPARSEARYPVVFFLHGLFEDSQRWVNRGGAKLIDSAIASGEFVPAIVIIPDAGRSFYSDSLDGKRPYARFFLEELVPHVDAQFRTRGDRAGRVIAGSSMGGYGALKFAFQRPDLFSAVAVHSAALLPDDPEQWSPRARRAMAYMREELADLFGDPINPEIWKTSNPLSLAHALKKEPQLRIYFDCGDSDSYGFDDGCRMLDEILTKAAVPHTSAIRPGGHGWDYLRDSMKHSLKFLKEGLDAAPAAGPGRGSNGREAGEGAESRAGGHGS